MSRAWDKEKIWVPDRIWTYDLPNTGRAICSGNSSILSSLGGQYTWSSKTTLLFALNFACSLFLSLLSWEGTYLQDNLSLWHYKILLLNPSTLSGHKKGLKKPFILSWKTLKPPTHSLMGKSYYYLFYKYDFFTKKNCVGFYSKSFMITEIGLSCSALFSLSSANGASQTESVCQQNKNESPAAYTTLIIKGTLQNRVWTLFKNNFQISRRFFSGCFITLYTNHSEWTYILLKIIFCWKSRA